jgi:AP-4 complex subunit mu-1
MNYRVTGEFDPPFRFFAFIQEISNYKLELDLRIKATFPKEYLGHNVIIKFAVPKQTSTVHTELPKVTYLSNKVF